MKTRGSLFVFLSVIVQMLAGQIVYKKYNEKSAGFLVVIGGVFPVHTSIQGLCGPITRNGLQYVEALSYFTQMVNSRQGPINLPGVKLGFEIHDSCETVSVALDQTLRLIISKTPLKGYGISAAVGEFTSSNTIPITNLLQLFNIPLISYSATAPLLSDKVQYPYFLRTVPPDNYQAKVLADIVNYFNWTYVVAVHSSDVYGKEGITAFVNEFKNFTLNRCVASDPIEIPYPGATVAQYDQAVDKLEAPYVANATVIVLFAQLETVEGLLDAVQRRRDRDGTFAMRRFVWVGTDSWTASLDEDGYKIAQNVVGVIPEALNSTGFDQYFQSLHISNHTDNPWFAEYWEDYFNCSLNGTIPAIRRCNVSSQSFSTLSGKSYVADRYLPYCIRTLYAIIYALRDIQRDLCNGSGLCKTTLSATRNDVSAIDGRLFLKYLLKVNFSTGSGDNASFKENGDPVNAVYTVRYIHDGTVRTIGTWDNALTPSLNLYNRAVWSLTNGTPISLCSEPCKCGQYTVLIHGQSSCCWNCRWCDGENYYSDGTVCKPCATGFQTNTDRDGCISINASYFSVSNAWAATSIAIACVGLVIVGFASCVFAAHFNNNVVKASSRELTAFLLVGILLCYLMPFPFIAKPSPAICAIRRFGIGFSFSICFSPILVRVVRIHRIFNREASAKPQICVSPLSLAVFTLLIILAQVMILVIWLGIEPPSIKHAFDVSSGTIQCGENPYIGLSIALGYNVILLLCTLYFAFRTRKVPENFNETKFINLTTYALMIIWIAFVPIYFGTNALGATFQTSSQVLATVLSASAILGCLILPKVYMIMSNKWNEFQVATTEATRKRSTTDNTLEITMTTITSNSLEGAPAVSELSI